MRHNGHAILIKLDGLQFSPKGILTRASDLMKEAFDTSDSGGCDMAWVNHKILGSG